LRISTPKTKAETPVNKDLIVSFKSVLPDATTGEGVFVAWTIGSVEVVIVVDGAGDLDGVDGVRVGTTTVIVPVTPALGEAV
jgi:hypothetical protein